MTEAGRGRTYKSVRWGVETRGAAHMNASLSIGTSTAYFWRGSGAKDASDMEEDASRMGITRRWLQGRRPTLVPSTWLRADVCRKRIRG